VAGVAVAAVNFCYSMNSFLLTALLLSLDSFIVSVALSPLFRSPVWRWRLAAMFGVCDGLAVLVGSALSYTGLSLHNWRASHSILRCCLRPLLPRRRAVEAVPRPPGPSLYPARANES
jgi:hypothetical protein